MKSIVLSALLISALGCASFEKSAAPHETTGTASAERQPSSQVVDSSRAVDELQKFLKVRPERGQRLFPDLAKGQIVSNTANGEKGVCFVSWSECGSSLAADRRTFCRDKDDVPSEVGVWISDYKKQGILIFELSRNSRLSQVTNLVSNAEGFFIQTNNWRASSNQFLTQKLEITSSPGGTLFKSTSVMGDRTSEVSCLVR